MSLVFAFLQRAIQSITCVCSRRYPRFSKDCLRLRGRRKMLHFWEERVLGLDSVSGVSGYL